MLSDPPLEYNRVVRTLYDNIDVFIVYFVAVLTSTKEVPT